MNGVQLLLIIGAGICISAIARKRHVEPGVIIVVLAAAASFIPGMPRLELEPEMILALVVPPLLYSATRSASFSSFGSNLRAIVTLGFLLVVLTAGVLGAVANWMLPTIGAAAAFTLGSVLAPPDTITTVSHGDEIGLPKRVTSILTGESLINDATALTLFAIALGVVNGEHASFGSGVLSLVRNAGIGVLIGAALTAPTLLIRKRLGNATLEATLVLLLPFTAYLLAEEAHASGILAVVASAFLVSANVALDPNFQYAGAYRTRLQENYFWPVLDFLLETFVFAYIGLQLKFVFSDLAESEEPGLVRTLVAAGVLLVVAIAFRLLAVQALFGRWTIKARWIKQKLEEDVHFRSRYRAHEERRAKRGGRPFEPPSPKETVLVGWTGMRGLLTLAAAAAIPETIDNGTKPFPGRPAIQAIALIVTLGTLLIQGTTVGWLSRRLKFDLAGEREETEAMRNRAREIVRKAGMPRPGTDFDAQFEAQRLAIGTAVKDRELTEEIAREMIEDIDLRQAAVHTADNWGGRP